MIKLRRPIVYLCIKATGDDTAKDKVVELALLKQHPHGVTHGQVEHFHKGSVRINPGVMIPAEATAVHHVSNAMVARCPRFAVIAQDLLGFVRGCDLAGFDIRAFGVPLLAREFARCNLQFPAPGTRVVDLKGLTAHMNNIDSLADAAQRLMGPRSYKASSGALEGARVCKDVLHALVSQHQLPRDVAGLEAHCCGDDATLDGSLKWKVTTSGREVVVFDTGKYKGRPLQTVAATDPDFIAALKLVSPDVNAWLDKATSGNNRALQRSHRKKHTHQAGRQASTQSVLQPAGYTQHMVPVSRVSAEGEASPTAAKPRAAGPVRMAQVYVPKVPHPAPAAAQGTECTQQPSAVQSHATAAVLAPVPGGTTSAVQGGPMLSEHMTLLDGEFVWQHVSGVGRTVVLNFGKYKGRALLEVAATDAAYINLLRQMFGADVCSMIEEVIAAGQQTASDQLQPGMSSAATAVQPHTLPPHLMTRA